MRSYFVMPILDTHIHTTDSSYEAKVKFMICKVLTIPSTKNTADTNDLLLLFSH